MPSKYEYQIIEDNGGGLALYVFDAGGIDGAKVLFAHDGYEYNVGQLSGDLDDLDAGGDVTLWDGNNENAQAMYDDLDDQLGWQKVGEGFDGRRRLYPERMGVAASLEFGNKKDNLEEWPSEVVEDRCKCLD